MGSNLPIDNIAVFIDKVFNIPDSEMEDFYETHEDLIELAAQIIALENAIYLMRRNTGFDGSNIDKYLISEPN